MRVATLDIGGMYIKSAVFEDGRLEDFAQTPTRTDLGAPWLLDTACSIIEGHRATRAGIAVRGQVDSAGVLVYDATYPDYCGLRLKAELEARLAMPVAVENDVNSFALAEGAFGAARGLGDYLCVTVGSGIGGAIVTGGKLWRGRNCLAGEFGLMAWGVDGADPLRETWEVHAAASALMARAQALRPDIRDGQGLVGALGDPEISALVDAWAQQLAVGLRSLIHAFDPPCLVLGGGLMAEPRLFEWVAATTGASLAPGYTGAVIVPAALGSRGGLWGAYLCSQNQDFA